MTYIYRCRPSGETFEVTQGITEPPLTVCPKCGSPVYRVLQQAQVVFYGAGFHCNDYGTRYKVD